MDETIFATVLELARRHDKTRTSVSAEHVLTSELGLESLDVAELVAMLEDKLGVDPFATTSMAGVRTVGDLCAVYQRAQRG